MKKLLPYLFILVFKLADAQTTCATAQAFAINGGCLSGSITDATVTTNGYTCGGTIVREYWLTFTLNSSSTINITSSSSNRNLALQLLTGTTCASLTQVACANANTATNSAQTESISNLDLAGGTYYLKILNVGTAGDMTVSNVCLTSVPDCGDALQICGNITSNGNSNGFATQDLSAANHGCLLGNEHQSSWYFFSPVTSGTLSMLIQTTVDYDFAIWQTGDCGNLGSPVRCSYSSQTGSTGLIPSYTYTYQSSALGCGFLGLSPCYATGTMNVTDVSEDQFGDKYVAPLNVVAGKTYILLIDNYTADGTSYTLDFTLSNGATLNCTAIALPVKAISFTGITDHTTNNLSWVTMSELGNDYYTLERSTDGVAWDLVGRVKGGEDNTGERDYTMADKNFTKDEINYYRLSQTDLDGRTTFLLDIVSVDNRMSKPDILRIVNSLGQPADLDTKGIVIIQYTNGTIERRFNN